MADLNGDGKESIGEKLAGAVDGASTHAKDATGGKFNEQIDGVSDKIEGFAADKLNGENPFDKK